MTNVLDHSFSTVAGDPLEMGQWSGHPVLVVNTASKCGFTRQYDALQRLHDRFGPRGLIVLAVPSNDFRQELADGNAVQQFCEMKFGLTIAMADITPVKGAAAHPFYKAVKAETGFEPKWNFNKVLVGRDGTVKSTWGAMTEPDADKIVTAIEAELG
ncbi:MAG: glutathione peroxidase [Rhodobacteraceae bacterium]|nr:glutathione peroxidase [Paracoccaceae bacterium]